MASKNNFTIELIASLDKSKSSQQIQTDISELQKGLTLNLNVNSSGLDKTNKDIKEIGENAQNSKENINSLGTAVEKFVEWQVIGDIIHGVQDAMGDMIQEVINLDSSLVEFNKVTDLSSTQLEEFVNNAYNASSALARTGQETIDAATEFSKAGYKDQALDLAKIALLYQNIADGEVSTSDATALLVSQMKSFNIGASESIGIIDKINEVSNDFAVSSSDLATSLPKVSATMAQAGNTISQTIALITAGSEIMTGQSDRVARGLRSITLNLQGMDDSGKQSLELSAKLEENFNKLGLTLYDSNGQLKSTFDILSDLASVYPTLDQNTKNYYSALIGGKTQVDVVNSVLSNFSTALKANETAVNSSGSAMKENGIYMDSVEAKIKNLQSSWQKFAIDTINTTAIKSLLDLGNTLLKLADTDIGRVITAFLALHTAMDLFSKIKFGDTLLKLASNYKVLQNAIMASTTAFEIASASSGTFTAAAYGAAAGVEVLTKSLLANPLFWVAAAGLAIYEIVKKVNELTDSFEKEKEKLDELNKEYDDNKQKIEDLNDKSKTLSDRIEELQKKGSLTILEQEELTKTQKENDLLQIQLDLLQKEQKIKEQEKAETAQKTVTSRQDVSEDILKAREKGGVNRVYTDIAGKDTSQSFMADPFLGAIDFKAKQEDMTQQYKNNKTAIDNLNKSIEKLKSEQLSLDVNTEKGKNKFEEYTKEIDEDNEAIKTLSNENVKLANSFSDYISDLQNGNEEQKNLANELISYQSKVSGGTKEATDNAEYLEGVRKEENEIWANNEKEKLGILNEDNDTTLNLIKTNEDYSKALTDVASNLDILNAAYDEQNQKGSLSLDTIAKLIQTDADYINYLNIENGTVTLSANAFQIMNQKKIESYVASLELQKVNLQQKLLDEGNAALDEAGKFYILADAKANAAKQDGETLDNLDKQIEMFNKLKTLDIGTSGGGYTYTPKKYTSSSSSSSSAAKAAAKAATQKAEAEYKATIDALYKYKNALDIAKNSVKELEDSLKSTDNLNKQAEYIKQIVSALQNQINKTKELKSAQVNQINDYANKLRSLGFSVDYNSSKNELYINNLQHLADLSGDTAKSTEKIISEIQSLNSNNVDLDTSVRTLTNDVSDYNKKLNEMPTEKLNKFNELFKEFQQSQLDAVEQQIKDIEQAEKKDSKLNALKKQLDILKEQADSTKTQENLQEKILAVEKARIELANAQKQKTLQVYTATGWQWMADPEKIKDAKESLRTAEKDLSDAQSTTSQDALQKQIDAIEKNYSDRKDKLQTFLDDQNYKIDKANQSAIESFSDLNKALTQYGLNSADYLGKATNWLNQYNSVLGKTEQQVSALGNTLYSSGLSSLFGLGTTATNAYKTSVASKVGVSYQTSGSTNNSSIYIDKIELPNVSNASDFVKALKTLPGLASSQASQRK